MTVEGIMGIRKQQLMARNRHSLASQIRLHTGISQSEMAMQARGIENGNGKGGMAPGHTPALAGHV